MKIIDISVALNSKITLWPNSPAPRFGKISGLKTGDMADDTKLTMSVHTGTHIDAPSHFIVGGKTIDQLPVNFFIAPVFVVHLPLVKEITAANLEKIKLPTGIKRILFKTANTSLWGGYRSKFNRNYVGLTADAARWIVRKGIKLVGVDYLSVAKFEETVLVHQILLRKNTVLLEGIDLSKVKPGTYHLICLPTKLAGLEAAPARAVLTSL